MDTTLSDIQGPIDEAANVLDVLSPDWPSVLVEKYRRDLADMKISSPSKCLLSELFGSYGEGSAIVENYMFDNDIEHFDIDPFACELRENYLWREAWRLAVERRLGD